MGTPLDTIESSYGQEFGNPHTGWGDLLTCYDGNQLIGYDDVGNLVIMGTRSYTWKHGRQLESISDVGYTWMFTYDANGMRKSRSNGSATYTYTYNGSKLMQMTRGTDVLDFYYDASGTPVAFKHNGTTYYYVTTLQGDILLILDADGEIVVSYDYDAWGKLLAIGGSMATTLGTLNPLTYRGYVYDHEYGLYYLQSRYYNPEWGRFLNADAFVSTGGLLGNNMFAYCGNNPVNREDPTGHAFVQVDYDFDGLPNSLFPEVGGGCAGGSLVTAAAKSDPAYKYITNTNERVVINAEYFAFYKGKLVIKLPIGKNAAFWGVMFIGDDIIDDTTIKHEYGHSLQCEEMGLFAYTFQIAIPSVTANVIDRFGKLPYDYYGSPWEAEADQLGGVNRKSNNNPWPEDCDSFWELLYLLFK